MTLRARLMRWLLADTNATEAVLVALFPPAKPRTGPQPVPMPVYAASPLLDQIAVNGYITEAGARQAVASVPSLVNAKEKR